jgi:hypothetical protein
MFADWVKSIDFGSDLIKQIKWLKKLEKECLLDHNWSDL